MKWHSMRVACLFLLCCSSALAQERPVWESMNLALQKVYIRYLLAGSRFVAAQQAVKDVLAAKLTFVPALVARMEYQQLTGESEHAVKTAELVLKYELNPGSQSARAAKQLLSQQKKPSTTPKPSFPSGAFELGPR